MDDDLPVSAPKLRAFLLDLIRGEAETVVTPLPTGGSETAEGLFGSECRPDLQFSESHVFDPCRFLYQLLHELRHAQDIEEHEERGERRPRTEEHEFEHIIRVINELRLELGCYWERVGEHGEFRFRHRRSGEEALADPKTGRRRPLAPSELVPPTEPRPSNEPAPDAPADSTSSLSGPRRPQ